MFVLMVAYQLHWYVYRLARSTFRFLVHHRRVESFGLDLLRIYYGKRRFKPSKDLLTSIFMKQQYNYSM